jgi:hypothetical protein
MKGTINNGEEANRPCVALAGLLGRRLLTQGDARGLACPGLRYCGPLGLGKTCEQGLNSCIHSNDPREDKGNADKPALDRVCARPFWGAISYPGIAHHDLRLERATGGGNDRCS